MAAAILSEQIRPVMAAIRTLGVPTRFGNEEARRRSAIPFITLSREPGAGAWTLAQQLAPALNSADTPQEKRWTAWDRELVEKVAADHNLSTRLIESIEDRDHSWLSAFLSSLSFSEGPEQADEAKVYSRVGTTIRALARAGRVIIVGRGGMYLTRSMPGGIHIRLVAPLEARIALFAENFHVPAREARATIATMEKNRARFYKRYWPGQILSAAEFTMTFNTAQVTGEEMISMIRPVVEKRAIEAERAAMAVVH